MAKKNIKKQPEIKLTKDELVFLINLVANMNTSVKEAPKYQALINKMSKMADEIK